MNGLGINNASKNDKDADILTPDEVALLRTHASDGTLTAEERELYSKHLEAMKKLIPEGKKKGKPYGLDVAKTLVTVALILLATITAISLIQAATHTWAWLMFVARLDYFLTTRDISIFWRDPWSQ
ncbi:hypothetical protein [uncultured Bifidobacterium sp.]|uniref:hypothetical protein n=1 Tax=uncultured Bifidobacterium sp. TaxID=165187 RepID=UPI00258B97EA|nr:hypothetical protein [uncultured Bifidobacterium sp.]